MLMATDQKLQKLFLKVLLPTATSPKSHAGAK